MLCLVSTHDLLSLYLAIELMSLSFYILAAYKRNSEFSGEAGLKYFILGAFSSGLLLFGSSILYGFTGMTNFEDIAKLLLGLGTISDPLSYNGIVIGILFVSIALLFKVAAAPFHMWSPDVYEGSPTPVTAFFSSVPKVALLALYLRLFFYTFYDFIAVWQDLLLLCAMISMVWGSIAALSQTRIKRLMAYSGIVNIGYMLIGIASGTITSVVGLLVYLFIYVVMTIGFFSFILGTQNYKTKRLNVYLLDLTNLGKTNIVLGLAVSLILFSMIGLPPLAGFFGKMYLFFAAMNSNLYIVAILGVMSSVVAAFYYIRLIKLMFFEMSSKRFTLYKQMDQVNAYVLSISLFLLIIFFVSSDALLLSCHRIGLFISL
jgi:NADH-quinone oxidoreductase subunit N